MYNYVKNKILLQQITTTIIKSTIMGTTIIFLKEQHQSKV